VRDTVLILIAVLIAVAGALIMISSGDEYGAERLIYRAIVANQEIAANPEVAPPGLLARVEDNLKKIVKKYPKTRTARAAYLSLIGFYWEQKKYENVKSTADAIIARYPKDRGILSSAYFLKGAVFQEQGEWNKALKEFHTLRDEYTDSVLGLEVPIYIADYYKEERKLGQAKQAYIEAVQFYAKTEKKFRKKALGYAAANLLMRAHTELEQYEQAGQVLESVFKNYAKMQVFIQQLPNIEGIFIKKLNNPDKALQLYAIIRDRTEDERILEFLDGRIKAINVQKTGQ